MSKRAILYFFLASLPAMLTGEMPESGWKWFVWGGTAVYQGLLALKALGSEPEISRQAKESLNKLEKLATDSIPPTP